MKRRRYGMTIIELLTVVAVIAILIGLLLPATTMVRNYAKNTAQRAQFSAINLGLEAFKSDFGYYPASNAADNGYGGAQKLAEAMLGLDLLGFNPGVDLQDDDTNGATDVHLSFYSTGTDPNSATNSSLDNRQDRYLELETANAFRLAGDASKPYGALYQSLNVPEGHVLCDVFERTSVKEANGKISRAGSPILYFRANTSKKTFRPDTFATITDYSQYIYNVYDNAALMNFRANQEKAKQANDPLNGGIANLTFDLQSIDRAEFFYYNGVTTSDGRIFGYVQDPKIQTYPWPYNSDTYLLISAGLDGLYGTEDDICNFGN